MIYRPLGLLVPFQLNRTVSLVGTALVAAAVLSGCDSDEITVQLLPGQPDTTGAAVWQYLQSQDHETNWQIWPEKGKLYTGQEPHGMLLTTYLNDIAYSALTNGAGQFPPGAIIVKENYMPDSTLAAVTTMYKVRGYNPGAANWFWVKHLPDGSVDGGGMAQGRVEGCIGCHAAQRDNDYVYTASLN